VTAIGRNKGLHIGTLTTQYFILKTNGPKVLGLKASLWKHNTVYGIDHYLAGIEGTSILECQIALPEQTVLCDKEKTG
jgi:hypothetical protein